MSDEEPARIAPQRRYLARRGEELRERIPFMQESELRWTVRVLRDCLPPTEETALLGEYSEHLALHELRHVVQGFVSRYTQHALAALEAKRLTPGTRLGDLTDEELQAMSAAEKWALLQRDPSALHPYQLRRELARLFACLTFELFHDPGLGEAAVEFNAYLDLVERLRAVPEPAIEALKDQTLAALRGPDPRDAAGIEAALSRLREAIGGTIGLKLPFDRLFTERMERWPRGEAAGVPEIRDPEIQAAVEGMSLEQRRTSLRVLVELMGLEEQRRELAPLTSAYRSVGEIPAEALGALLPRLSMRLGDRTICDFALRYRAGRLWARERIDPAVWRRLPFEAKFMLLETDNAAMDLLQTARHLSRLLLTERYELLVDPAYQVGLTTEPVYRRLLDHCMRRLGDGEALPSLNRQVTRMMLELEERVPEPERPARYLGIREAIATGLGIDPSPPEA